MPEGRKTDPEDTSLPSRAAGGVRLTLTVSTPRNSAPGEKEEAGVPRECVRDRWWGVWVVQGSDWNSSPSVSPSQQGFACGLCWAPLLALGKPKLQNDFKKEGRER